METIATIVERFQPHGTTLLVEPIMAAEKSSGGIIIPEACRNPLDQGKVVSVGTGLAEEDWLGKLVMWTRHSESKLRIDDVNLVVVGMDNIVLCERVVHMGKKA